MTKMDWAMGADRDTGVTEMGRATGSIYSGDPGVDSIALYLVSCVLYHLISL